MPVQVTVVELRDVGDPGGFGACKLVTHPDYNGGQPVVQKINLHNTPDNLRRFGREQAIQAELSSEPNFLSIYSPILRDGNKRYYLMELAEGGTIRDYIANNPTLSVDERLDLIEGICRGLQTAHLKGYVHRDLHFKNILIKTDSGQAVPVLVDFGRARDFNRPAISHGDQILMLPYLYSPEAMFRLQLSSTRTKYELADIYSLGLMIQGIMTGSFYPMLYVLPLFTSVAQYLHANNLPLANTTVIPLLSSHVRHINREKHYNAWLATYNANVTGSLRIIVPSKSTNFNDALNEIIQRTVTLDYRKRYNKVEEVLQRIQDARNK
jgi:serine/threonine protein kinase